MKYFRMEKNTLRRLPPVPVPQNSTQWECNIRSTTGTSASQQITVSGMFPRNIRTELCIILLLWGETCFRQLFNWKLVIQ